MSGFPFVGGNFQGPVINMLYDFNVDRTGNNDVSSAFLSALSQSNSGSIPAMIYWPPGTYAIDAIVDDSANANGLPVVIAGAGMWWTRFKCFASQAYMLKIFRDVIVMDCFWDGGALTPYAPTLALQTIQFGANYANQGTAKITAPALGTTQTLSNLSNAPPSITAASPTYYYSIAAAGANTPDGNLPINGVVQSYNTGTKVMVLDQPVQTTSATLTISFGTAIPNIIEQSCYRVGAGGIGSASSQFQVNWSSQPNYSGSFPSITKIVDCFSAPQWNPTQDNKGNNGQEAWNLAGNNVVYVNNFEAWRGGWRSPWDGFIGPYPSGRAGMNAFKVRSLYIDGYEDHCEYAVNTVEDSISVSENGEFMCTAAINNFKIYDPNNVASPMLLTGVGHLTGSNWDLAYLNPQPENSTAFCWFGNPGNTSPSIYDLTNCRIPGGFHIQAPGTIRLNNCQIGPYLAVSTPAPFKIDNFTGKLYVKATQTALELGTGGQIANRASGVSPTTTWDIDRCTLTGNPFVTFQSTGTPANGSRMVRTDGFNPQGATTVAIPASNSSIAAALYDRVFYWNGDAANPTYLYVLSPPNTPIDPAGGQYNIYNGTYVSSSTFTVTPSVPPQTPTGSAVIATSSGVGYTFIATNQFSVTAASFAAGANNTAFPSIGMKIVDQTTGGNLPTSTVKAVSLAGGVYTITTSAGGVVNTANADTVTFQYTNYVLVSSATGLYDGMNVVDTSTGGNITAGAQINDILTGQTAGLPAASVIISLALPSGGAVTVAGYPSPMSNDNLAINMPVNVQIGDDVTDVATGNSGNIGAGARVSAAVSTSGTTQTVTIANGTVNSSMAGDAIQFVRDFTPTGTYISTTTFTLGSGYAGGAVPANAAVTDLTTAGNITSTMISPPTITFASAHTFTVSSAANLVVGMTVLTGSILSGTGPYIVTNIAGTTITVSTNCTVGAGGPVASTWAYPYATITGMASQVATVQGTVNSAMTGTDTLSIQAVTPITVPTGAVNLPVPVPAGCTMLCVYGGTTHAGTIGVTVGN